MDLEKRVGELKANNKKAELIYLANEAGVEVDEAMNKTEIATAIAEQEGLESTADGDADGDAEPTAPAPRRPRVKVPKVVEGAYVPTRQIRYQPKGGGDVKTQPAELVTMVKRGGKVVAERTPNVRRDISDADVNAFLSVDAIRPHMV